jgi:hypothetical protein
MRIALLQFWKGLRWIVTCRRCCNRGIAVAIRVGFAFITSFALVGGEPIFVAHTMVARGLDTPFVCAALALIVAEPIDVTLHPVFTVAILFTNRPQRP